MEIAIIRAAHLHIFIDELRDAGVPVESTLARSRLPPRALEDPDAYVSFALCLEWLGSCSRDFEAMEFGYRAARRASLDALGAPLRQAILCEPTGYARIVALLRCAALEDNVLSLRMQHEGDRIRVISTMESFAAHPCIGLGEWVDLQGILSVVRSVAGPRWCPDEMTFISRYRPTPAIQEAFPNCRILVGQPCTSILIGRDILAAPHPRGVAVPDPAKAPRTMPKAEGDLVEWNAVAALRAAIRPYLADGYPSLPEMAEALHMSTRTLQRRLKQSGRSYSDVVQEARFDLAQALLLDRDARIVDVAMSTGYGNQQHFARAFRRYAGVSPTDYRRLAAQDRFVQASRSLSGRNG